MKPFLPLLTLPCSLSFRRACQDLVLLSVLEAVGLGLIFFFFCFWSVLLSLIRSAAHRGLDGDGLPENLQPFSPFSSWNHNGDKNEGRGQKQPPHCPSPFPAVPTLGDNPSAHFSCAFLRKLISAGAAMGIALVSLKASTLCPPLAQFLKNP